MQVTSVKMEGIKFRDPILCHQRYPENSSQSLCVYQADEFVGELTPSYTEVGDLFC